MSGAIPQLPLYAIMAWTGKTLLLPFFVPYLSPVHFPDNKLILELKFETYLSPF